MMESSKEIRLEAFRQHWNQIRHTENLRHGFTSFYVLIVVAVLAFVSQTPEAGHCPIYAVAAVLSLLGLLFSCRAKHSIRIHREKAISLAKGLSSEKDIELFVPFTPESGFSSLFSMRNVFLILYGLGFLLFIILLILERTV